MPQRYLFILFLFFILTFTLKGQERAFRSKSLGVDLSFFGYSQKYSDDKLQYQLAVDLMFDYFISKPLSIGAETAIDAVNRSIDWRLGPYIRYFVWEGAYIQPTYLYGVLDKSHWIGADAGYALFWNTKFSIEPGITFFKVYTRKVDFVRWGMKLGAKYYF